MGKHTAGPWSYSAKLSGSENHKGFRVGTDSSWLLVADVMPIDSDGGVGRANARLIAAAPELLAALKVLLNNNESLTGANAARAAIAKAEGEA